MDYSSPLWLYFLLHDVTAEAHFRGVGGLRLLYLLGVPQARKVLRSGAEVVSGAHLARSLALVGLRTLPFSLSDGDLIPATGERAALGLLRVEVQRMPPAPHCGGVHPSVAPLGFDIERLAKLAIDLHGPALR